LLTDDSLARQLCQIGNAVADRRAQRVDVEIVTDRRRSWRTLADTSLRGRRAAIQNKDHKREPTKIKNLEARIHLRETKRR
jgi:hypothetical protein